MKLDLKAAFELGLKSYDVARGDEATAHVSDLPKCLFEVWARRNKEPQVERGAKSRAALQSGLRDETWIVDRIERGLDVSPQGWKVIRAVELPAASDLVGHIDVELARIRCRSCERWMGVGKSTDRWYCSHYCDGAATDYDSLPAERMLIEVKTTEWREEWFDTGAYYDSGKPVKSRRRVPWPDSPKLSHRLQAMGYVQRRPRNPDGKHMPFAIVEWCRASFQIKCDWFDGDDPSLLALHDQRTKEVVQGTGSGIDPILAGVAVVTKTGGMTGLPREKWQCAYCTNAMCDSNISKDNEAIPL